MLAGPLGIIGFSSYVTHTEGRTGVFYAFAGVTSDVTSFFDKTYFAGVGIDLFGILGAEIQLETVGVGASVNIGNFSISLNANLFAATSVTFAWDTDLGNGSIHTTGITIGVNTVGLLVLVASAYLLLTSGFATPSTVPGPVPQPII